MTTRKDLIIAVLAIFFCLTLTLFAVIPSAHAPIEPAQTTTIRFRPQPLTVQLGDTFQAECWVDDVTDLIGVEIQTTWDPAVIRYVSHTKTIPVETYADGILHSPTVPIKNTVDETASIPYTAPGTMYWLAEASMVPAAPFTGSGMAFIMTFQAVALGDTWINFTYTALADLNAEIIPHDSENTRVSVYNHPPAISTVEFNGTSPYPYVPAGFFRPNEPVMVTASITYFNDPAATMLCYRANNGSWWNTTMDYNSSTSLWSATIPSQQGNSTIEFFIIATDTYGNTASSSEYSFDVRPLLLGDVNGDGTVDIFDVVLVTAHYGNRYP